MYARAAGEAQVSSLAQVDQGANFKSGDFAPKLLPKAKSRIKMASLLFYCAAQRRPSVVTRRLTALEGNSGGGDGGKPPPPPLRAQAIELLSPFCWPSPLEPSPLEPPPLEPPALEPQAAAIKAAVCT